MYSCIPGCSPMRSDSRAPSSITYFAIAWRRATLFSGVFGAVAGTFSAIITIVPSLRTNTMSSGVIVSFIQKPRISSAPGNAKSIPWPAGTNGTFIRPCSRCASVAATASRSNVRPARTSSTRHSAACPRCTGLPLTLSPGRSGRGSGKRVHHACCVALAAGAALCAVSASSAASANRLGVVDLRIRVVTLHVVPVFSRLQGRFDGHAQLERVLHLVLDNAAHRVEVAHGHLEDQLVVDLQQHHRVELARAEPPRQLDHRELYQVGGRALQRRVGGFALRRGAQHVVARAQIGHVPPAPEQRL